MKKFLIYALSALFALSPLTAFAGEFLHAVPVKNLWETATAPTLKDFLETFAVVENEKADDWNKFSLKRVRNQIDETRWWMEVTLIPYSVEVEKFYAGRTEVKRVKVTLARELLHLEYVGPAKDRFATDGISPVVIVFVDVILDYDSSWGLTEKQIEMLIAAVKEKTPVSLKGYFDVVGYGETLRELANRMNTLMFRAVEINGEKVNFGGDRH